MVEYQLVTGEEMRNDLIEYTNNVDTFEKFEIYKQNYLLKFFSEFNFDDPIYASSPIHYSESDLADIATNLRGEVKRHNAAIMAKIAAKESAISLPPIPKEITAGSVRRLLRAMRIDVNSTEIPTNQANLEALYRQLRKNLRNRNYRAREAIKRLQSHLISGVSNTAESIRETAAKLGKSPDDVLPLSENVRRNSPQIQRILDNYNTLINAIHSFILSSEQNYEASGKKKIKSTADIQTIKRILTGNENYSIAIAYGDSVSFGNETVTF